MGPAPSQDILLDIQQRIVSLQAQLPELCKRIDRVEGQLWGNAHTGLIAKVNTLVWVSSGIASMTGVLVVQAIMKWFGGG